MFSGHFSAIFGQNIGHTAIKIPRQQAIFAGHYKLFSRSFNHLATVFDSTTDVNS